MKRSPPTKEETNNLLNPEVATTSFLKKNKGSARRLVDYTQQRGEGEKHTQEVQSCRKASNGKPSSSTSTALRRRRMPLLQPGIPMEIVLDKKKSKVLTAEHEEEAAGQQQKQGEEMVEFLLRIPPAASKHPSPPLFAKISQSHHSG
jgi:hypothetical protein